MQKPEYNKEFKVKIEKEKCIRYKTFQPELPTKKFIFTDEIQSIHMLKILPEDSSDQNKATTTTTTNFEEQKQQPEKKEGKVRKMKTVEDLSKEYVSKAVTGKFRDNIRRIDLVLVVTDDVNKLFNDTKNEFLTYILRAGLEVEVEPGVMKMHKNLTFIKIYAPDSILKKYGRFFGSKRYFADTRYDFMNRTRNYEKEWVRLVRRHYETPYGYSNYERSIIVYKILLHLPFGDNSNNYGIERLLKKKIILDVFALHDGPYFITPHQTIAGSNARQILNYYWSSIQNIFTQQPIHLIHEYFGPRLAFYFAFYEFFTKFLKVAAFLGILNIIAGILNLTNWEKIAIDYNCVSDFIICPPCYGCLRHYTKHQCQRVKLHLILDHIYLPLYSFFTVIASFVFVRLWQRREYFLNWIWEVGRHDSYYKYAVRPLFDTGSGSRTDPFISGLKHSDDVIPIFVRNVISKIIILLYWYMLVPYMLKTYTLYKHLYSLYTKTVRTAPHYVYYIMMTLFQTLYILLMTAFEKIYDRFVHFIVNCENHSFHEQFSKSIVIKKIGFKMFYQYALIGYYAWIYGQQDVWPECRQIQSTPYITFLYLMNFVYGYKEDEICDGARFCFPYTCIQEVSLLLTTLLIVTQIVYKIYDYIFFLKTDYNQDSYKKSDIPCWEREYRLSSCTEEDMLCKYINLAAQFTLVTWFVIAFPLGPLILYVLNVWHIRHEARKLLLASRRPLLIKTPGTQMTNAFFFIAFVAVITNAINITTVTRTGLRHIAYYRWQWNYMAELDRPYIYVKRPVHCFAPNLNRNKDSNNLVPDTLDLLIYKSGHLLIFVLAAGFLIPIIFCLIPQRQQEVKKLRAIEETIRNLYYHYEYENTF